MSFRKYLDVQDAIIQKRGLENLVKKNEEKKIIGEDISFTTDNGNLARFSEEFSDNPSFVVKELRSYITHNYGRVGVNAIVANCVKTGFRDTKDREIYIETYTNRPFVCNFCAGDGWSLGSMKILSPRMISDDDIEEYHQYCNQCKNYNEEIFAKAAEIFKLHIKTFYDLKKKGHTTKDIETITELVQEMPISESKLDAFEKGDYTWNRYFKFFKNEYGNLPTSISLIFLAIKLLKKNGKKNNAEILKLKEK